MPDKLKYIIGFSLAFYLAAILEVIIYFIYNLKFNVFYTIFTYYELIMVIFFPIVTYYLLFGKKNTWIFWLVIQLGGVIFYMYVAITTFIDPSITRGTKLILMLISLIYLYIYAITIFSKESKEYWKSPSINLENTSTG